jgi:protocatechuate 3,4-dioxygenase beta subunit
VTVGQAVNPGDEIRQVTLKWGDHGIHYNFAEFQYASIQGNVHLSDPWGDCDTEGIEHPPLAGVTILLRNAQGQTIAQTTTDANGQYRFDSLLPGSYTVVEVTPAGLIDGDEHVGNVAGTEVGQIAGNDTISGIQLTSGQAAVSYDFCEHLPASLSGFVYHDINNNGLREPGEQPIANVALILLDQDGNPVILFDESGNEIPGVVFTDASGAYRFDNLRTGTYTVLEFQPPDYSDGLDTAGTIDSVVVGVAFSELDEISEIRLGYGQHGVEYNFGELRPSSITGMVHIDLNRNCVVDPGEPGLAGVLVELLDSTGRVIESTLTDRNGQYRFDDLKPGIYSVRETQPRDYFQGGQVAGSAGGNSSVTDRISQIPILSGQHLTGYNFCEVPPSGISGFVFQDGPAISTLTGKPPDNLFDIRDGQHTADDTPLAGVVLELRNGISGDPIMADQALPGFYPPGPIRTTTDANGFYHFAGLAFGNYAVYEIHPDGYVDFVDTPGTTSGIAINRNSPVSEFVLFQLTTDPKDDAIIRIPLAAGVHSRNNNFSEVRIDPPQVILIPDAPTPLVAEPPAPPIIAPPQPVLLPVVAPLPLPKPLEIYGSAGAADFTWHLSVIDAGQPRGSQGAVPVGEGFWLAASLLDRTDWRPENFREGQWTLQTTVNPNAAPVPDAQLQPLVFGVHGGIPVVGDFDGDGIDDFGVFYKGEWFLDLNHNGRWDEQDLWARLGDEEDLPVTGDWDGDGKDDIGIYGPIWPRDPRAIEVEPGLPDSHNDRKSRPKNVPPTAEEATDGHRLLRLTAQGQPRADLIDHVFRYGTGMDVPVAGDWNGDGIKTVGVFHDGTWRLDMDGDGRWSAADIVVHFGKKDDIPVVGDFDGNGVDEIGVYRKGKWIIDANRNRELDAHDRVFELGGAGDLPIVGDWNGDGIDDAGIYQDLGPRVEIQARK